MVPQLTSQSDSKVEEVSRCRADWTAENEQRLTKRRQGYERLCCVRCIATRDMNFQGSTCICRVPKAQLKKGIVVECPHCGESVHLTERLAGMSRADRCRL